MENAGEKFPSFEDTRSEEKVTLVASPHAISPLVNQLPVSNWPARRSSRTGWEDRNGGGLQKHQPKRSVSEAFENLRQRRGSISANTQELAEALKAPISYKLIVSKSIVVAERSPILICAGTLCGLVHDLSPHKHVLKVNLECASETCYLDNRPIRLCVAMVSHLRILGFGLPKVENSCSSVEA